MAEKIPLVLGVTGHRDIPKEDFGSHEETIRNIFRDYKSRYPATPLKLLTGLAEGGDRIAARAALDEDVQIIPILPMAQADFEQDFTDDQSLADFRDLLAKAAPPIVASSEALTEPAALASHRDRQRLYRDAGIYIVGHCNILIAIWDGYDGDAETGELKPGGAAATVKFRSEGLIAGDHPLPAFCRADAMVLNATESGPIIHVPARRRGNTATPNDKPFARNHAPIENTRAARRKVQDPEQVFARLDVFNSDVDRLLRTGTARIAESMASLLPESEALKHSTLRTLRSQFASADVLAVLFRDRVQRMLVVISALALAAFASFELFEDDLNPSVMLAAYLSFLVVPWVAYFGFVRPRDWQGKYLDYRALAEALRVQLFWRMAGIPLNAADFYLRRQISDLAWVRHAARVCNIGPIASEADADPKSVQEHWIAKQGEFFDKTAEREEVAFRRWDRRLIVSYCSGLFIAGAFLLAMLSGIEIPHFQSSVAIVLMGFAPALAAAIGFVLEHRAYKSHIRQYDLMADLYGRANMALASAKDANSWQSIVEAVGREVLAENGDWYFMHRERRVAPPRGG